MKTLIILFIILSATTDTQTLYGDNITYNATETQSYYQYCGKISNCLYAFLSNGKITLCANPNGKLVYHTLYIWKNNNGRKFISLHYVDEKSEKVIGLKRWEINTNPYYGQSTIYGKYKYWVQLGGEVYFIP